jgi:DME family drug/metabolite transporter
MKQGTKHEIEGYLLVLLATFCYGTAGVIGRMVYRYESNPLTVAMFQGLIAVFLAFLVLAMSDLKLLKIRHQHLPFFIVYGFLGMFCTPAFFYYAIKYTTVTTASILFGSYPVVVVLFSKMIFHELLTRNKLISLLLTFIGTALVVQCYQPQALQLNLTGILFGLLDSISMAAFTLFGKRAAARYHPKTVIFYVMLFGVMFQLLFRVPQGNLQLTYPSQIWFWFLLLALLPAVVADLCYVRSLRYLEAGNVGIVSSFQVVVASLLAFIFLRERMEMLQILGAGLVLWGILLVQWQEKLNN